MSSRESRAVVHSSARRRRWSKETAPDMSDLRIVLLGKSVSENSLVGNFLLGRAAFDSEAPPDVVERVGGRLKDRHVMVINSPQLLQTNISDHQITQTVRECVNLSDPGPHVIILLLKHDQCSAEDQECVQKVLDSFSECVYQHTMVLTTQEPTETNDILQKIIQKCFNRHFSLQRSSSPVDLLQMFEDIVTINDGRHLVCAEGSQYFTMEQQATERLSECLKLNLVVCGSDGTLKSSISELILRDVELHGRQISLVDLPALFNTRLSEEEVMRQTLCCVSLCHPGVHVFLLIVPDAPLNNEDKAEMEEIQRIFSSRINKHMMILIIQSSEHQTAELNEETQSVIESFGGRHHFFGPNTQVSTLMENIEKMLEENRGEFYSTETFLEAQMKKLMKYKEMKKKIHSLETHLLTQGSRENTDEVRIVLLGKTGVGKSATGNTILGRNAFTAETSQESVTKESRRETSEINGRHITVIDTPGLFDTELSNEEIQREIRHCISMILPGPHVFIIVLNLGQRFIKEEATSVKIIQETFGEKSLMYTMVLFTRGDDLKNKTIEQCLGKPGSPLMNLIEACGNRFHVFNNNQTGDRTQVSDLLEKIDNMVTANGGSFYSCKMFREMEREKQEQQMKILMDRDREREEVMKKLEEIRRERETFKNEIDQLKQEKEKIKTEKEKLQIKYDTEIERLRNRIENERQNHETERKKWEEEFDEREERQKTFMKEKEEREEKMCEMKREREEWEKQKLEEKRRREDEDEKRRHEFNQRLKEERERMKREKKDLQSKHDKEEKKMKILMENLNREREELMKKHVEEKERMKMMMEEERQNQDKERKRREEELKGEIREEEKHQREIRDEMRRERETFRHEIEEMKKEKENMKKEKENLKITYNTEIDRLMNRIENERQNHDKEKKRREEEFSEREEQYKREVKEKEELLKKHEEEKDRLKMTMEEERQNQDKQRKRREEEFREREERYKRIIKDREERENKMIEQMKLERMQWEKQKQEERKKREEEKKKQEEEQKSEQSPVSDQRKMSSPQQRIPINIQDIPVADHLLRRIVLLGKSGVGMSAAGNTILGQNEFKSVRSTSSVTSECSEAHVTVSGRSVSVVDTPGFVDTQIKPEYLVTGMARSVYISSPGPHAFLIVFDVNMRFSEQEQQIPEMIKMMFGQEVLKYSIILFTHGDQIEGESVEELIEENSALSHLVDQCGGRYHVFNNKDQRNREQVNDLLQKIDTMIEQNGGGYYSTEMFEEVQRFRCEEEERRQEVEKQIQEEIERLRKEREEKIRAEMRAEYESLESERQREERKQQNLNCVCS